jgi:protein phosphatase 2C family protein 2/3
VPITNKFGQVTGTQRQMLYGPYRVLPGRLSVSRTFGDIEAKFVKFGGKPGVVSAVPEISQFTIDENQADFIVLGCDGIFDRLTSVNVIDSAWSAMQTALKQSLKNETNGVNKKSPTIH